jgi:glycerol-3-phosphate dehydrogenase
VRYLEQGDVSLVREALKERGLMAKNAGHLVKNQSLLYQTIGARKNGTKTIYQLSCHEGSVRLN